MNNVEKLRNYFLGKDPQLKETMADNSLRLIGIPGKEFVLKAELYKRLVDLKKQVDDKDEELQANIDAVIEALSGEQEARMADDEALQRNIDRESEIRNQADTTLQGNIDAEARARSESDTALADNFELLSDEVSILRSDVDAITVPTKTSDLTNDGDGNNNYYTLSSTSGLGFKWDSGPWVTYSGNNYGLELKSNRVTMLNSPNNYQYPTTQAVYDYGQTLGKQNYSTTEQVIGTWIDNKPLYSKTATARISTSSGGVSIRIDPNMKMGFIHDSFIMGSDNMTRALPSLAFQSSTLLQTSITVSRGEVTFENNNPDVVGYTLYVTVYYTKTTD